MNLDFIAERRIREAQERGDFDDLPGAGAPLELDDGGRTRLLSRINFLLARSAARPRGHLQVEVSYLEEIARRLEQCRWTP